MDRTSYLVCQNLQVEQERLQLLQYTPYCRTGALQTVSRPCFLTLHCQTHGHRAGVCNLLEQKLERDILYLACRHHFTELILAAAFKAVMGVTCCSTL